MAAIRCAAVGIGVGRVAAGRLISQDPSPTREPFRFRRKIMPDSLVNMFR